MNVLRDGLVSLRARVLTLLAQFFHAVLRVAEISVQVIHKSFVQHHFLVNGVGSRLQPPHQGLQTREAVILLFDLPFLRR